MEGEVIVKVDECEKGCDGDEFGSDGVEEEKNRGWESWWGVVGHLVFCGVLLCGDVVGCFLI